MSRWLDSFRAARTDVDTPLPIAPIAPIGASQRTIGTIGTIGTGLEVNTAEANVVQSHQPLTRPPAERTPQDWLDHYEERAAIIEFDGGQPREAAERQALADTISHWMVMHPPEPTDDTDGCVHCGAVLGDDGVPVLAGGAHTWLHSACHQPWLAERRRKAVEALGAVLNRDEVS